MSKFDEVPNIMSKVVGGCFLYWIKIADNMSEKTADIWTKSLKRTFLAEQMFVVCGTPCL